MNVAIVITITIIITIICKIVVSRLSFFMQVFTSPIFQIFTRIPIFTKPHLLIPSLFFINNTQIMIKKAFSCQSLCAISSKLTSSIFLTLLKFFIFLDAGRAEFRMIKFALFTIIALYTKTTFIMAIWTASFPKFITIIYEAT